MQKIYALVFLLMFSSMQYGKLLSYWNCKITNSSDTQAVQCDCEKILSNTNGYQDTSLVSKINIKDKTEEWFAFDSIRLMSIFDIYRCKQSSIIASIAPTAFKSSIFQPPRNS